MIDQWPATFPTELQQKLGQTLLIPAMTSWPEGVPLMTAPEVEAVARPLIGAFHPGLANAQIAFLFREDMQTRERAVWGKAMKASARLKLFGKMDFTIDINWTVWSGLGIHARAALVDHELQHCYLEDDGRATMIGHDLEEFVTTVQRWGLWRPSIELMATVMPRQGELFDGDGQEADTPVADPVGEPAEAQPALVP
jgi:hypothetical protein